MMTQLTTLLAALPAQRTCHGGYSDDDPLTLTLPAFLTRIVPIDELGGNAFPCTPIDIRWAGRNTGGAVDPRMFASLEITRSLAPQPALGPLKLADIQALIEEC